MYIKPKPIMIRNIEKKKGFALVELVVVLVILAILAAFLIPIFSGHIDKAKQNEYRLKLRSAVEAAESIIAEEYANGTSFDSWRGFTNITNGNADIQDRIYSLSGVDKSKFVIANVDVNAKGQLIFVNLYSKKQINGQYNRLVYLNGTIGGKEYNNEVIVSCWNGVVYYEYKSLDPAQAGYIKD